MIYNRADIVNFMKPTAEAEKYDRMTGFTAAGKSMNASTYDRRYVDEKTERSDAIAYATAIGYNFDRMTENAVHTRIAEIHDKELVGQTVEIVTVNFNEKGTSNNSFKARKRVYSVVPDADGDSTDAYTYSGAFKANGNIVEGEATSTDDWKTCTFVSGAESQASPQNVQEEQSEEDAGAGE